MGDEGSCCALPVCGGWGAENARTTAWLGEWQGHWSTELTLGAMLISVLCLTGWRLWAGMALGGLMLGLFYWPVEAGWTFALVHYSGGYTQLEPAVPTLYRLPSLLIAGFVAAYCLLGRRGWALAVMEARSLWWLGTWAWRLA